MFLLAVIIPASIFLWFTEKGCGSPHSEAEVQQRIDESRICCIRTREVLRDPEIESSGTDDLCRYLNRTALFPVCQHGDSSRRERTSLRRAGGAAKGGEVHFLEYFIIDEGICGEVF